MPDPLLWRRDGDQLRASDRVHRRHQGDLGQTDDQARPHSRDREQPRPRPSHLKTRAALLAHQVACRACTVCAEQGIIAEANPTFEGRWDAPFFLVGQAPGPAERETRRPFAGRAGKELDRWMLRAGFRDPEEFRRLTYIAALMRCFPGRNAKNTGDLRPPPAGIANCAHWLDAELRMLGPKVLILVGQMAIARFLGPGALEDRVGKSFGERPVMIPLPHPSGQNRWLNVPANRDRLASALALISELRANLAR
ncbi:MAG: uracil-DNA glycosylase [Chloroflexi bacterium]|nr:MAG: uracil-DNA glycosylase [Chloroflexota bacterium]